MLICNWVNSVNLLTVKPDKGQYRAKLRNQKV
jgi:hypothetical protein